MAVEISAKPSVVKNKQNEATFLTEDKKDELVIDLPQDDADLPPTVVPEFNIEQDGTIHLEETSHKERVMSVRTPVPIKDEVVVEEVPEEKVEEKEADGLKNSQLASDDEDEQTL